MVSVASVLVVSFPDPDPHERVGSGYETTVLAVSTLRPRDYIKYTARVYGPDPISVRAQSVPLRAAG